MVKKEYIENYFVQCARILADALLYNWSNEYKLRFLTDHFEQLNESLSKEIDWNNLTVEDCNNLKFGRWTSEEEVDEKLDDLNGALSDGCITMEKYNKKREALLSTIKLRLIPAYLYGIIPEGLELTTINGNKLNFKKGETDNDNRFGMLGYGVMPTDAE